MPYIDDLQDFAPEHRSAQHPFTAGLQYTQVAIDPDPWHTQISGLGGPRVYSVTASLGPGCARNRGCHRVPGIRGTRIYPRSGCTVDSAGVSVWRFDTLDVQT